MSAESSSNEEKNIRVDTAKSLLKSSKVDDEYISIHRHDVERMILYGKAMALINMKFQKLVPIEKHPRSSDKAGWAFDMLRDYNKLYELDSSPIHIWSLYEERIMRKFEDLYEEDHEGWSSDDERYN